MPEATADLIREFVEDIASAKHAATMLFRERDEYDHPAFSIKAVRCFVETGYSISRIRPGSPGLRSFRIIFALDTEYDDFYLLAVVKKTQAYLRGETNDGYNYEPNHPTTNRIRDDYDALGLPRLSHR